MQHALLIAGPVDKPAGQLATYFVAGGLLRTSYVTRLMPRTARMTQHHCFYGVSVHNQHRLPPMELVVVARFEAADATPEALRGALERLWQRVAALKPPADAGTMPPASDPLSDCPRPADPAPGAPEPVRP